MSGSRPPTAASGRAAACAGDRRTTTRTATTRWGTRAGARARTGRRMRGGGGGERAEGARLLLLTARAVTRRRCAAWRGRRQTAPAAACVGSRSRRESCGSGDRPRRCGLLCQQDTPWHLCARVACRRPEKKRGKPIVGWCLASRVAARREEEDSRLGARAGTTSAARGRCQAKTSGRAWRGGSLSRDAAEMRPRCGRGAAEVRPRCGRDAA